MNGDTKHYDWDSGYTCHQLGSGAILIQLGKNIYYTAGIKKTEDYQVLVIFVFFWELSRKKLKLFEEFWILLLKSCKLQTLEVSCLVQQNKRKIYVA